MTVCLGNVGVAILSLVTIFFKTCSLAASQPGVPALAVAETRFTISAVAGDKFRIKGDALPIVFLSPECPVSLISINSPLDAAEVI